MQAFRPGGGRGGRAKAARGTDGLRGGWRDGIKMIMLRKLALRNIIIFETLGLCFNVLLRFNLTCHRFDSFLSLQTFQVS